MVAPPNQGTEMADFIKKLVGSRRTFCPAGLELGTNAESTPNQLKAIHIEIGVIAGTHSINPFFSAMIRGRDDGMVAVERTKMREMTDFLVVPCNHTFIMSNPVVLKQAVQFLERGRFSHARRQADDR